MFGVNKKRHITAVWQDWGFRLNLKMVLYLGNLCLTEKSRIFILQPRQAPERQAVKKPRFSVKTFKFYPARIQIKPYTEPLFLGC
jgi:hypothetical protein